MVPGEGRRPTGRSAHVNWVTELVGFIASVVSLAMWWPQAVTVWRSRHRPEQLAGVSVGTQALLVVNASLWAGYAVLTQSFWVGAPSLVNLPLAALTIAVLRRRPAAVVGVPQFGCPTCSWPGEGEHRIFITVPPGYGSLMRCSDATAPYGVPVAPGDEAEARRVLAA